MRNKFKYKQSQIQIKTKDFLYKNNDYKVEI